MDLYDENRENQWMKIEPWRFHSKCDAINHNSISPFLSHKTIKQHNALLCRMRSASTTKCGLMCRVGAYQICKKNDFEIGTIEHKHNR